MKEKSQNERFATLTEREREVLQLVCKHYGYQEIADEFVLSINTIKKHMFNVFNKLGLHDHKETERVLALHNIYCPLFSEENKSTDDAEEIEIIDQVSKPNPISQDEEEVIDGVEKKKITYTPKPKNGGKEKMGTGKGRRRLRLVLILIIVSLLVFVGLQALKWFNRIPIFSSSSAYEVGEWHEEEDMWIRLRNYELTNYDYDRINLSVEIWNKSDKEIHFSWDTETNLELKDNLGTRYELTNRYIPSSDNETLLPQERSDLIPGLSKATAEYLVSPMFENGVTELLFSVDYLSRFEKVTWRIPVNK